MPRPPRPDTADQSMIIAGLRAGRQIGLHRIRRRPNRTAVMYGFSDTEPVHKAALYGLIARGRLTLRPDGGFEETEP